MAAIKGKDTKPEVYIRSLLFSRGYRFRKNSSNVPGHPDIWLRKYNTAIFINGCFWHRHINCKYAYVPKSRIDFWEKKFSANIARDEAVCQELRGRGIKCLVVWECSIRKMRKSPEIAEQIINTIESFLQGDGFFCTI